MESHELPATPEPAAEPPAEADAPVQLPPLPPLGVIGIWRGARRGTGGPAAPLYRGPSGTVVWRS